MQTSSQEFLSMMTSTLSVNWSGGINRACEVCFGNLRVATSLWPMISPRKLFCALIKTSAAFAAKRVFPPGFTGSRITVFAKTRGGAKNLSASMKSDCKASRIRKLPTLV